MEGPLPSLNVSSGVSNGPQEPQPDGRQQARKSTVPRGVRLLLQLGADRNATGTEGIWAGRTALEIAQRRSHLEELAALLRAACATSIPSQSIGDSLTHVPLPVDLCTGTV